MSAVVISTLTKTCPSHPAQWEATTNDGRFVYLRFRFGHFSAGIGRTMEQAVMQSMSRRPLVEWWVDDPWAGELDDEAYMIRRLPDWIEVSTDV